jgi:hypothetical protein
MGNRLSGRIKLMPYYVLTYRNAQKTVQKASMWAPHELAARLRFDLPTEERFIGAELLNIELTYDDIPRIEGEL